jgi:Tol biopolymer transport system component
MGWSGARAHRARAVGVVAILGLALAACDSGTAPTPSPTALPSVPGSAPASAPASAFTLEPTPLPTPVDASVAAGLAFVRSVDGRDQVFVIDEDGSERQVSGQGEHAAVGAAQPLWSPDRTMLAFGPTAIGSGLDARLWIANADGSGQRQIATLGESTDWSPDSSRLVWTDSVFTTDNTGEPARMWVADLASGEVTQLTPRGTGTRWLSDGMGISFMLAEDPERGIMVMDVGGGEPRELIDGAGGWWSPDGTSILVERLDGIYLADADGSNAQLLVGGAASPAWSPDGGRVAFVDTDASGNFVVGVVSVAGEIAWQGSPGIDPAWSPDGEHLAVDLTISEPRIGILDAATGAQVWELEGRYPDW